MMILLCLLIGHYRYQNIHDGNRTANQEKVDWNEIEKIDSLYQFIVTSNKVTEPSVDNHEIARCCDACREPGW